MDTAVSQSDDFLHHASGGRLLPGSIPLAHRYGGHQVKFVLFLFFIRNRAKRIIKYNFFLIRFIQIDDRKRGTFKFFEFFLQII